MNYNPEVALEAVLWIGNIDGAAKSLGVPIAPFRAFCREHGISAKGDKQPAPVVKMDEVLVQENRKLKQQIRRLTEGEYDAERVVRRLEKAILDSRASLPPLDYQPNGKGDRTAQDLILMFSDTHASEVVSLEETRGINEYNWDVMLERMNRLSLGVLSHAQHYTFRVKRLHVHLLGDMLSGDIHDELVITNDRPTVEAIVQFSLDTAAWLRELVENIIRFGIASDEFDVMVAGVPGNHPRYSKKPSAKQAHNNADWVYYKMLELLLREDPLFEFDFPRGAYNVQKIAGRYRVLLMHGDGIRTSMPGVPWGGVVRRVTTLEQQFSKARQPLDYIELGHFHSRNSLDGIQAEVLLNGSVKGADEYSLKQFGHGHDAKQLLYTAHPEWGITGTYPLNLQTKLPASEGW